MAPYLRLTDFLEGQERDHVRIWLEQQVPRMAEATIIPNGSTVAEVDPAFRTGLVQMDTGMVAHHFDRRLSAAIPYACERLGVAPFNVTKVEVQATLYPQGGVFGPHVDDGSTGETRTLSAVWYHLGAGYRPLHGDGGELVIHGHGDPIWVPPVENSVVIFPSSVLHEVRPKSGAGDRWTINVWLHRP